MKLQLEFEDADLREMIETYFKSNGFKVKNLDQLCAFFHKAFPDGIKVQAETLPPSVELKEAQVEAPSRKEKEVAIIDPANTEVTKSKEVTNLPMSATDLFDPTPGRVPTRDEQLRQSREELEFILNQSKIIEKERSQ
jgi:hypothetical protein